MGTVCSPSMASERISSWTAASWQAVGAQRAAVGADGHHARLLKSLARVELLILDDWGLAPMTAEQRRDLEIMEDRHGRGSTMVTSQLPVEHWHEIIGDPTLADAILDRLVHNAHRLTLMGESHRSGNHAQRQADRGKACCGGSVCHGVA